MPEQSSNPLQHPDSVLPNESPYHSSIMGRVDYELVYLPTGYKLLFVGTLAIVILGVVWTLMVWAVNMRMGMRSEMKEGKRVRNMRAKRMGEERRPIDKVSKYAHRHGNESEVWVDKATNMDMDSDDAVTSAAQIPFSYLGNNAHVGEDIEIKYRPRCKTHQPNRPRSRPLHTNAQSRTSTAPSPVNPFLDPPPNRLLQPDTGAALVKRTSLEWQTGRAAFFSSQNRTSTPVSRPVSPVPSHVNNKSNEPFELNVSDMEALEAGTVPLTGRKHISSCSSSSSPGSGSGGASDGFGLIRKSRSWVDQGVGFVDGAVDAFAAKLGRWTDDDGGNEALLLPVARQGRGEGVRVG
ncbi:uncharacterized protein ALTATR162_LOCUS5803 [Alternaria atra]|uniref:Uncharacterized protein n=1 Tax=Alternaria atra TaxID=119953 RepID=A0A8J2I8N9_9PLEO|nr:uncharacterized protein ALTATR162_LOCUS5803 [Alternaria atra]CAG5160375.1 unnamed protein product [Alternaria atra]